MTGPLEQLRRSLAGTEGDAGSVGDFARVDIGRERRKGVPEIVLAAGKTAPQVVDICRRLLEARGRALVSRTSVETVAALEAAFGADYVLEQRSGGRLVVLHAPGLVPTPTGGRIGLITAGTSDVPYADEAAAVAGEMGCAVRLVADVGVAGLHRLFPPLTAMLEWDPDVIVVAAGMDGVLPSVVSGLVPVPVIGLPTPIGYGLGGEGVGALTTMLQSCAPGLVVVNIGNGVGAGATAALIANRLAQARAGAGSS